ncbi:hypothetical protein [Croceivirga radicis]|uniref:Uncharacterized protein n=1 Tax=Croceivirga radicis TaxID=1929488 RepID=A0A1V6LNR6_9FLAO|nr:hypothetical protein [Croceivirga radicis]OQD41845.1 hypothetical protein BUL40_13390 [Croceivirga radicis]
MKAYKIKSLLYFAGFVAAAVMYYNLEQQDTFQEKITTSTVVETQAEDLPQAELDTETFEKELN